MIDGTEKRKRQLAFELQSSRVFETRSKKQVQFHSLCLQIEDYMLSKEKRKLSTKMLSVFFIGLKINPGLALIGLRTTRPRT